MAFASTPGELAHLPSQESHLITYSHLDSRPSSAPSQPDFAAPFLSPKQDPDALPYCLPGRLSGKPALGSQPGSQSLHHHHHHSSPLKEKRWKRCRLYLYLTLSIQSIGVIGCLASIYATVNPRISFSQSGQLQTLIGYLVIFIIATLFSLFIAIDSTLNQNTYQLISLCIFNLFLAVFGSVIPIKILQTIDDALPDPEFKSVLIRFICLPGLILLCSLFLIYLTYYFHKEFGWQSYKQLGADLRLKSAFRFKSIFFMLQKFNFFFLIGFCVIIVQMRRETFSEFRVIDWVLPASALLVSCLVIIFSTIAVEFELKTVMFLYGVVWAVCMAFLGYESIELHPLSQSTDSQHSLILFSALTIGMLFLTGLNSIICYRNFGMGLKEARRPSPWLNLILGKRRNDVRNESNELGDFPRSPAVNRRSSISPQFLTNLMSSQPKTPSENVVDGYNWSTPGAQPNEPRSRVVLD